jgi:hypothetical protein
MRTRLLTLLVVGGLAQAAALGDIVTDWNNLLLDAVRNESTAPPLAARNMAIVHLSVFNAVNAFDRDYRPYHFDAVAPVGASRESAAIGAAYQSLVSLYPSQRASFDAALDLSLNRLPSGPARDAGLSFGAFAAGAMLSLRSDDGSSTTVPYIPNADPGAWRRTPPTYRPPELPQWPGSHRSAWPAAISFALLDRRR